MRNIEYSSKFKRDFKLAKKHVKDLKNYEILQKNLLMMNKFLLLI